MAAEFMGHTSNSLRKAAEELSSDARVLLTQVASEVGMIELRHQGMVGEARERGEEWGWEANVTAARDFRHAAAGVANTVVCAVCSCRRSPADMMHDAVKVKQHECTGVVEGQPSSWWQPVGWDSMPGKHLLQVDLPAEDVEARRSTTLYVGPDGQEYHLQPAGVLQMDEGVMVKICRECLQYLSKNRVPPFSLLQFDTGPWPSDEHGPLAELTVVEALFVAPVRAKRLTLLLRNASNFPGHKAMRGHVLAVRSPCPASLAKVMLPHRLEDVLEDMQVGQNRVWELQLCGQWSVNGM
jgi:hypothetical protein